MEDAIEVNGKKLHVQVIGDGPAVLFMHGGLGLSHDYFRPFFDRLAANNTLIFYDHLGNGRSEKPDEYSEISFDRLASDASELMTSLGHETFTLIGHSYGGFIAQHYATLYADRLDGLVLIGTVPTFDYQPTVSGPDANMQAFGKLFSEPMADDADWRAIWSRVVEIYFHQWDPKTGADIDARTVYEHRAWNAAGALLESFNTLPELPKIATRALVVAGRHDGITPPEHGAERIASLLPDAELRIFEASGHYPFIEEEEAFFQLLETWLQNLRIQE